VTDRVPEHERSAGDELSTVATLEVQLGWIEAWLQSSDAERTAFRLVHRRQLGRSGHELLNELWIRCRDSFDRRSEPYPEMQSSAAAHRFAARSLDNLSRDWRRSGRRDASLVGIEIVEPDGARTSTIEDRVLIEQLLRSVGRRAQAGLPCAGCRSEVVTAAALEVLHLVLAGEDGGSEGRTWFDRVMYEALDRLDGRADGRSQAARAQYKRRCGLCVQSLLEAAGRDLGEVVR
jgi:hypothetical protein